MEPDNYFLNFIHNPQQIDIRDGMYLFDKETLKNCFTLWEGVIPDFDATILESNESVSTHSSLQHCPNPEALNPPNISYVGISYGH